ncbi:MAG: ribonuclease HII [Thermodesulfovibrionales bacterium]|nr:ribonuclease HII [Thermodesulfovibrionales bacterium]
MDPYHFDNQFRKDNCSLIAGIDEAGRGPLAGPVVASAVILPSDLRIDGIRDSKTIPQRERELLYEEIFKRAISIGIGLSTETEIDTFNILQASILAMQRAVVNLSIQPDFLLIDAIKLKDIKINQEPIIKGDTLSASIGAASIIAKVTRDKIMDSLHEQYPEYGFNTHKGYPTRKHIDAIRRFGLCPVHRRSFKIKSNSLFP